MTQGFAPPCYPPRFGFPHPGYRGNQPPFMPPYYYNNGEDQEYSTPTASPTQRTPAMAVVYDQAPPQGGQPVQPQGHPAAPARQSSDFDGRVQTHPSGMGLPPTSAL
jgi:hypothetical protein